MRRLTGKDRTNTIPLLILIAGVVFLFYYGISSLSARDPLWFASEFEDQPVRIVIYDAGQITELHPGQADFDALAQAVQASLSKGFARLTKLGLSEHTLHQAYTRDVTLELFFRQPVELHTWFDPGRTTQMLFPITGPYADAPVVLLGDDGQYRAGAPALKTNEPIQAILKMLGYD
ncbi:MAG: hypothetical protein JXA89_26035 [Anaerolineae bacterium]|nr:hypothetical protein [Anaerolineae bacterium]